MNKKTSSKNFWPGARIFFALLAAIFLVQAVRAQPSGHALDNRWLLIFDTSSQMRKCLPTTQTALSQFFVSAAMSEQLRSGDTIGAWIFSNNLGIGRFPLQNWNSDAAGIITSNIIAFTAQQHYTKSTHFEAVMPLLNRVVQGSERLTVLIFCDGDGQIQGTPYDAAINAVFKQNRQALQKAKQPFVVVLRSQFGEYVGCKISSPPATLSFPSFPPLPEPPQLSPAVPVNQAPPPVTPSLVIVGTTVGTNLPAPESKSAPTNPPPATNTAVIVKTNPPPLQQTNAPVMTLTNPIAKTKAAAPPENSGFTNKKLAVIGAILLAAAGSLMALMIGCSRRRGGSLITRSMNRRR